MLVESNLCETVRQVLTLPMNIVALIPFVLFLLASAPAVAGYEANGVPLGASEGEIKKVFPTAFCKPLEWTTQASDRRCDNAKISFGGVEGRITFYLKKDVVQAFDLRFDSKDYDRLILVLKSRYGKPSSEVKDVIELEGKPRRETYKALWESGRDRAALVSQVDKNRSQLTVSRGNWEEEIYKVR